MLFQTCMYSFIFNYLFIFIYLIIFFFIIIIYIYIYFLHDKSITFRIVYVIYECIDNFNSRCIVVCNCNCQHYRTKFYFGFWCLNKVIIIIIGFTHGDHQVWVNGRLHIYSVIDSFRLPPKAGVLNVLEKWHVAFHGTSVAHIRKILDTGDLILPGNTSLLDSEGSAVTHWLLLSLFSLWVN